MPEHEEDEIQKSWTDLYTEPNALDDDDSDMDDDDDGLPEDTYSDLTDGLSFHRLSWKKLIVCVVSRRDLV